MQPRYSLLANDAASIRLCTACYISAAPRLHLGCISAAPRLHLGCISQASIQLCTVCCRLFARELDEEGGCTERRLRLHILVFNEVVLEVARLLLAGYVSDETEARLEAKGTRRA